MPISLPPRYALLLAAFVLTACEREAEPLPPEVRPVRVVTVDARGETERVSLSGVVEAQSEVNLAFRGSGRMIERLVDVGDTVTAGQVVARLDPEAEQNGLRSAQAAHASATAQLIEAQANFERQAQLLERGFTTRQRFDEAQRVLRGAESAVDSAAAQVEIARVRLEDTVLVADASGAVTDRGAEPGEVVAAGRMIVQIARDGGRDAVFDVPASLLSTAPTNPVVEVALTINPSVRTTGRVREIAPQADAQTGTFRVRVGLEAVPEAMRLGSTVTGSVSIGAAGAINLPASALTAGDGGPAVWVVDQTSGTVSLRRVEVVRHGANTVTVGGGLESGEIVVTAGVQALRPGQRVRLLGDA